MVINGINSISLGFLGSVVVSMITSSKEWPSARKVGQLWYEILDFSTNLNPLELDKLIDEADQNQYIIAMHPHGIIPFQAILWSAYCDQYLRNDSKGKALYGFGAAADIVMYLPFLKNVMGWLSAGSASYKYLYNGLVHGQVPCIKGRIPRHLYILPGGIAEIFTSTPGKSTVVFSNRRGLVKLSLETGASLLPTYVFGGTDFYHNLATGQGLLSRLCRKYRIGITIFWGRMFLPIPYLPKVTMCIAEPILVKKWEGPGPIPSEDIENLHNIYVKTIYDLFEKYKNIAGYPNATLEII
eukprot:gene17949-23576_t